MTSRRHAFGSDAPKKTSKFALATVGCPGGPEYPGPGSSLSCRRSLNFMNVVPDAARSKRIPCACGQLLALDTDWFCEIHDGTLQCAACAACSCCGLKGYAAARKLVSISGFVLCYGCLAQYGVQAPQTEQRRRSNLRAQLQLSRHAMAGAAQTAANNAEYNQYLNSTCNLWQTLRCPEGRRILRYRAYPRPRHAGVPRELDPAGQPQEFYSATKAPFDRMVCPSCRGQLASKQPSVVVPAISIVYHLGCFRCLACRCQLSQGCFRPGSHYVFCTCNPPKQWCRRQDCEQHRMQHHREFNCRLEPTHPGGRALCDPTAHCDSGSGGSGSGGSGSGGGGGAVPNATSRTEAVAAGGPPPCGSARRSVRPAPERPPGNRGPASGNQRR